MLVLYLIFINIIVIFLIYIPYDSKYNIIIYIHQILLNFLCNYHLTLFILKYQLYKISVLMQLFNLVLLKNLKLNLKQSN